MSNPSVPAHRSVSNVRPAAVSNLSASSGPHTPARAISSNYGSPSALRAEDECIVIELGSRFLRIGFAGDATPKTVASFGPDEQRRAGDYRHWSRGTDRDEWRGLRRKEWGSQYELWKLGVREVDLGLVGDKVERAVREAFTKHLLMDSRSRQIALVLPSALPLPLLSAVLDSLFANFQPPTISLLSAPVMTVFSAGLRAGIVVDIGWAETTITAIYEYREINSLRSVRASKLLGDAMSKLLEELLLNDATEDELVDDKSEGRELVSFEECEEVITRLAWCKPANISTTEDPIHGLTPVREEEEFRSNMRSLDLQAEIGSDGLVSIPLRSAYAKRLKVPFAKLAEPCESAFFAAGKMIQDLDDEEWPLHLLLYRVLLSLPVDVRSCCMSRIIFQGGSSKILGIKERTIKEVSALIQEQGWSLVRGRAVEQYHNNPKLLQNRSRYAGRGPIEAGQQAESSTIPKTIAAFLEQEHDTIDEALMRDALNGSKPVEQGYLRAVDSLGAWAGGSLISQLKVPAVSVIEREQWLMHGAAGASRSREISMAAQRQSIGPTTLKSGGADRLSWTMGQWA